MSRHPSNRLLPITAAANGVPAEGTSSPTVANPMAGAPLLWDLPQAAAALQLSTRSLKRAAAEGALPPGAVVRPFGRRRLFNRLVLERWVADGCPPVRGGRCRR